MTIHFRSRIQSPIDYTSYLFPGTNGCCCTGTSEELAISFQSTYGACNALGGYFTVSSECGYSCLPKGATGCCCACSYAGLTEGIEKATCEDKDGIWQAGSCSELIADAFCISGTGRDVRLNRKCCGYTLIGGITQSKCYSVCTEEECSKLTVGNYVPIFYPGTESCESDPECPVLQGNSQSTNSSFITGNSLRDSYGNCCVQGIPCKCYESISFSACERLNGSFYVLGDKEFSCENCISNCTRGDS